MSFGSGMPGRHRRAVRASKAAVLAAAALAVTLFSTPAAAERPRAASSDPGAQPKSAKFDHDRLSCTRLADVSACDDALRTKPDNLQLLVAKADALLHGGRAADAILTYRRAQALQPGDEGIKTKLADAESQRQGLVSICEGTAGAASVDACQAALLHGAADEFLLLKRKGMLLQGMNRADPALDAFIAAGLIRQDDKSVALAIVALTDSTGRNDALALAARASSLRTLGRAGQAAREEAARRQRPAGSR